MEHEGVAWHEDPAMRARGVVIAFSERTGGVSVAPYASLDLAAHVGDVAERVDENRSRLLDALGIGAMSAHLTTAEQVHGARVAEIEPRAAGAGASATRGSPPIAGADALTTTEVGIPLMLLFADCVPLVLVVPGPRPAVAVVHAGWRGALAGIAGNAVRVLAGSSDRPVQDIIAYVGAHIGSCCYEVGEDVLSRFTNRSANMAAAVAGDRLDLGAAVSEDLAKAGVSMDRQCHLGVCTAQTTDRYFSYRAEGVTGRHGALAVILGDA